jgi:hypothetical protein
MLRYLISVGADINATNNVLTSSRQLQLTLFLSLAGDQFIALVYVVVSSTSLSCCKKVLIPIQEPWFARV